MTYNENRGQTFQMVRSEENLDEPHQQTEAKIFDLFFEKSEGLKCRCTKVPTKSNCTECKGSKVIEITPDIKNKIEKLLQQKVSEKFQGLQLFYKQTIRDWAHFIELHKKYQLEGKFKNQPKQTNLIPMTPQPSKVPYSIKQPQSQMFYKSDAPISAAVQNRKNKSPNQELNQPHNNESILLLHNNNNKTYNQSSKSNSNISNTSNLKDQHGNLVNPNEHFPNTTNQRISGNTRHQTQIKIPISGSASSGRPSGEMLSSQKSQGTQQLLTVSQSPLYQSQSGINSNQSTIGGPKLAHYQANLKEICIDNNSVEPLSPVYFKVKLLNNGTYKWPDTVMIKRIDNESVEKSIRPLYPSEEQVFQVQFFSPQQDGNYYAEWRLCYVDESGEKEHFGPRFKVEYKVKTINLDKKKNYCTDKLAEVFEGSRFEIESYVIKKLSEKTQLDIHQLISLAIQDLETNPNLFKSLQGIPAVKPQVKQ